MPYCTSRSSNISCILLIPMNCRKLNRAVAWLSIRKTTFEDQHFRISRCWLGLTCQRYGLYWVCFFFIIPVSYSVTIYTILYVMSLIFWVTLDVNFEKGLQISFLSKLPHIADNNVVPFCRIINWLKISWGNHLQVVISQQKERSFPIGKWGWWLSF